MSHYSRTKTAITSARHLVQALEDRGFVVEQHATPQTIVGYRGVTTAQANIVVRRVSQTPKIQRVQRYDFGYLNQTDGSYALVSETEDYNLLPLLAPIVAQTQALHVTETMAAHGFSIVTETAPNGEIVLTLSR